MGTNRNGPGNIYRRLLIGQDGHLDQSDAYNIYRNTNATISTFYSSSGYWPNLNIEDRHTSGLKICFFLFLHSGTK